MSLSQSKLRKFCQDSSLGREDWCTRFGRLISGRYTAFWIEFLHLQVIFLHIEVLLKFSIAKKFFKMDIALPEKSPTKGVVGEIDMAVLPQITSGICIIIILLFLTVI